MTRYQEKIPELQLSILHDQATGYGIEPFLLVNSLPQKTYSRVIDLGTGNGIIPLLIARLKTAAEIWGIEMREHQVGLAQENIALNKLTGLIQVQRADIRNFTKIVKRGIFDLVVMNPPFYQQLPGETDPDNRESGAVFRDFIATAAFLCKKHELLAFLYTPSRLEEVFKTLDVFRFTPKRLIFIHKTGTAKAQTVIVHAAPEGKPGIEIMPSIFLDSMTLSDLLTH